MYITEKQCIEFNDNPTVNPITKRKIKVDGPTFLLLQHQCNAFFAKAHSQTPKPVVFYIEGIGCSVEDDAYNRYFVSRYTNLSTDNIIIGCNPSTRNIAMNVIKRYCYINPSSKSPFVQDLVGKVSQFLKENRHVFVMGHSYGGSVASRIAEELNNDPLAGIYLHVATFGTIMVPKKPELVSNIDILHHMISADVALKCNGLKPPKTLKTLASVFDPVNKIQWFDNEENIKRIRAFGKENWQIHASYRPYEQLYLERNVKPLAL
jgi:pimeloyl-ACP methyl ester carboxylesterase